MFPRLGKAALLLVIVSLLLPFAVADHAYSHRYIIYGRVVDANGNPVPGMTVNVERHNFGNYEGTCTDQSGTETDAFGRTKTIPVTNQYGEFMYCYHAHQIPRVDSPTVTVTVAGTNFTKDVTLDAYFRQTFVPIQLNDVMDNANTTILDTDYTVLGRIWRPGEVKLEAISVYGLAIANTPVNVTLTLPDGTKTSMNTITNTYGDFAVRIPTVARVTGGTVSYDISDGHFEAPVDSKMGITTFKTALPKTVDPFVKNLLITAGVIAVVAVAGGFGYRVFRRTSQKRDEAHVRATSTRKRAQR
ncbi:MAG: hypothetical protein WDA16_01015 [Candidatus Thermoplasmatota archaeon]